MRYFALNYFFISGDGKEIVGGVYAKKGEFPWVVGIWRWNGAKPICGGSILNKRYRIIVLLIIIIIIIIIILYN